MDRDYERSGRSVRAGTWMSNEEDKKGTLSVGKWADLAVLSDDYLTVPENRISQLSSVLT